MKRKDLLIAKLKAKQMIRQAVALHQKNFAPPAPPQPQQEQQNAGTQPIPTPETPTDQPDGLSPDDGSGGQP